MATWGRLSVILLLFLLIGTACQSEDSNSPATATPTAVSPTSTPAPSPTATPPPSPTPTPRPTVSTDLAFIQDGNLWLATVTKSDPPVNLTRNLEEQVATFHWLRRADEEVAQRIGFVAYPSGPGRSAAKVYIMHADGTGRRLVTNGVATWSADGSYLAMIADEEIVVVDSTGKEVSRLAFGPRPQPNVLPTDRRVYGGPAFSPDGKSLLAGVSTVANMGASGNTEFYIYQVPLASGEAKRLPGMTEPVSGRLPYDLAFSPDGKRIAFTTSWHLSACSSAGSLWVMDADGGNAQALMPPEVIQATRGLGESAVVISGYDWSPRSDAVIASFLVVNCDRWRETGDMPVVARGIYVLSVDGKRSERITQAGEQPRWSPDGQLVAYTVGEDLSQETAKPVIHILDLNSKQDRELGQGKAPAWRPIARR